jgi:hypothetical protein
MQYGDILIQLNTLPDTYLRPGPTFAFLQASKAAALQRFTNASDGLINNLSFSNASGVWLDVWGELFTIPRNAQESDGSYAARIPATLVSGKGTPVAIILYLLTALGYSVTITEDFVNTAWQVQFSVPVSLAVFNEIMAGLNYVRPAGVPGSALIGTAGGLYIGTVNYLGAPKVTGAYMISPHGLSELNISAFTNNTKPLLPTTFLTDPTLNPGLG